MKMNQIFYVHFTEGKTPPLHTKITFIILNNLISQTLLFNISIKTDFEVIIYAQLALNDYAKF